MLGFIAILVLLVLVVHYYFRSYHLKSSLDILSTELRKTESELTDVKKALSFSDMKVSKDSQGKGVIVGVNRTTRKPIIQPRMPVTIRNHPSPEIFGGISGWDSGSSSSSDSSSSRDTSSSSSSYSGGGGDFSGGGSGGDW